jgi:putative transposase
LRCRQLIQEAVGSGARLWKACEVIGITVRSYRRWGKELRQGDGRHAPRSRPANALSQKEVAAILAVATSVRFRDLAVSQIVPILAEEALYVASEFSFYRVLR